MTTPREDAIAAQLREAYTLLVSAEPTLIRDAETGPNAVSLIHKVVLRDRVTAWLEPYRDNFDAGLATLAAAPETPDEYKRGWNDAMEHAARTADSLVASSPVEPGHYVDLASPETAEALARALLTHELVGPGSGYISPDRWSLYAGTVARDILAAMRETGR